MGSFLCARLTLLPVGPVLLFNTLGEPPPPIVNKFPLDGGGAENMPLLVSVLLLFVKLNCPVEDGVPNTAATLLVPPKLKFGADIGPVGLNENFAGSFGLESLEFKRKLGPFVAGELKLN